jgi:hypothetical protein
VGLVGWVMKHTPERIVAKLREHEKLQGHGAIVVVSFVMH